MNNSSDGIFVTMVVIYFAFWLSEYIGFTIALTTFGKFNVAASFAVIYVITGELFPTVIRNGAVGTSSCFARIGGMVAPYVAEAVSLTFNSITEMFSFPLK